MKVIRILDLFIGRLHAPSDNHGTQLYYNLIRPQDKNDPMGNQSSDFPAVSALPKTTAPLRICSVIGGFFCCYLCVYNILPRP